MLVHVLRQDPSADEVINQKCAHCTQLALGVENTLAVPTFVGTTLMSLTVVLVLATGRLEESVTSVAVVVFLEAVYAESIVVLEMAAALATVVMSGTVGPVLLEGYLRVKVPITITAVVVIRGV